MNVFWNFRAFFPFMLSEETRGVTKAVSQLDSQYADRPKFSHQKSLSVMWFALQTLLVPKNRKDKNHQNKIYCLFLSDCRTDLPDW
jgi:hypothetical protein